MVISVAMLKRGTITKVARVIGATGARSCGGRVGLVEIRFFDMAAG